MVTLVKSKQLDWFIKAVIVLLLVWALYKQLLGKEDLQTIWAFFLLQIQSTRWHWLVLAVGLMPANWSLETLKWKILLAPFVHLPFWRSFQGIMAGVTISLFTPNRIGEYGGRILLVEARYNWKTVIATLVGSFSQLAALLSCGLMGFLYFAWRFMEVEIYVLQLVLVLGLSLMGFMLFCFFNIDLVVPVARRIQWLHWFKKYLRHLKVLSKYSSGTLGIVLGLSLLRYLVYSTQFFFMLRFFGIDAPFLAALSGISTIFLVQTSLPLPPVMGLLARGQVALFVWSFFGGNELSVLAATYSIFVINLVLPALLGVVIIVQTNVLKSLGYENGQK